MGIREILERKNASVGVFGIGRSNDGVIRYLKQLNPSIKLTLRSDTPINEAGSYEVERIFFGEDAMKDATEDVIFISPSVRRDRREFTEEARIAFSTANTNMILVGVTAALAVFEPLYAKLIKKINTSIEVEVGQNIDVIEISDED